MLTLKTKEKFWQWLSLPETRQKNDLPNINRCGENAIKVWFLALPLVCQQALVVDFFRTVNIIVDVTPYFEGDENSLTIIKWMPNPILIPITNDSEVYDFDYEFDYVVALSKAIEKADELFNLKN